MFPAAPVGLENVHVPVPSTHVPAETPPQLGRVISAAGGVDPAPAITHEICTDVAWPPLADATTARPATVTIERPRHSRRSMRSSLSGCTDVLLSWRRADRYTGNETMTR